MARRKLDDEQMRKRSVMVRKLSSHRAQRKDHERNKKRIDRRLEALTMEARKLEPPMSTYDIAEQTGVSQSYIALIVTKSETPTQERN